MARPGTTCSTPSASTCSSVWTKRGGLPAARKAHAEYFATLAAAARTGLRTAGVADLDETARARARQPLGRPHLRSRRARSAPRRSSRRRARVVLRHGRARLRGACVHRSCAGVGRGGAASAAHRADGVPLLPRDRGRRPRGGGRGGRARALAGGDERRAVGNRNAPVGARIRVRLCRPAAARARPRRGSAPRVRAIWATGGEPRRRR